MLPLLHLRTASAAPRVESAPWSSGRAAPRRSAACASGSTRGRPLIGLLEKRVVEGAPRSRAQLEEAVRQQKWGLLLCCASYEALALVGAVEHVHRKGKGTGGRRRLRGRGVSSYLAALPDDDLE